jgi:hypothetical protein
LHYAAERAREGPHADAQGYSMRDPILLTPGPLTTSATVKQAMLRDWGSRD